MSLSVLLPVMLIILTGACVQSALGFGATMVTMGFLPLLMDYGKALGLSIALVTISTAYISVKYRKQIQWKIMLPFLIPEGELPFENGDWLFIPDIRKAVAGKLDRIRACVIKDGGCREFTLSLGDLTDDEREIISDGCLINYYRSHS